MVLALFLSLRTSCAQICVKTSFLMFYYVFSRELRLGEFLLHLEEKLKRYVGFSGVTSIPSSLRLASKRCPPPVGQFVCSFLSILSKT